MKIRRRSEPVEAERFDPEVGPWPAGVKACDDDDCPRLGRGAPCYRVESTGFVIEPGAVIVRRPGRAMVVLPPDEFAREWEVLEGE